MMSLVIAEESPTGPAGRIGLRYFSLYRLALATLFLILVWSRGLPAPLGTDHPVLFGTVAHVYFGLAVLGQIALETRAARESAQVLGQVLLDIAAVTLFMYASGGVGSGFGTLLVVSIAIGGLLTEGRIAYLCAGFATWAVLAEELCRWLDSDLRAADYTQAGLLGAAFFATAYVGHGLARRLRASEARAARQAADLENLARLNERIVQRMRSGILVLDRDSRVRLMNDAALALLGRARPSSGQRLTEHWPEFEAHARAWDRGQAAATRLLRSPASDAEVLVSLAALAPGSREGTLVFVEDAAETRQRAQQLKLASLGRLTASIAHEVRNPLGAISHAAQLLSESEATNEEDRRLMRIIQDHSGRVNRIIENVLRIGRRDGTAPEVFAIEPWLTAFVADLIERRQLASEQVLLALDHGDIRVVMDPTQLHQVLWNLCENALRYCSGSPLLTLRCGRKPISDRPYLDVIDGGPGIPEDIARHVFEPFVSRDSTGTGLGLYIASELCECNQATLNLHANGPNGCTFRIDFAHPGRQQWIA